MSDDLFGPDPQLPKQNRGDADRPSSGSRAIRLALGFLAVLAVIVGIALVVSRTQSAPGSPTAGSPADPAPSSNLPDSSASGEPTTPRSTPSPGPRTPTAGFMVDIPSARKALETLPVKGRAPKTGYDRDQFGSPWEDVDGNGCDTRNDILQLDLADIRMRDDCIVESGILLDPFSGATVPFQRGVATSAEVQIDHLVPLSNAWQTGAQQLSQSRRVAFANDPGNLLAVRGDLNAQKGDGDAATWLPPNKAFRCQYVAMQVLVKERHGLWLTAPEKAAIQRILERC